MHPWRRLIMLAGLLASLAVLTSCSTPAGRIQQFASQAHYAGDVVKAGGFDHQIFTQHVSPGELLAARGTLHVYLEGDGQPWRHRTVVMLDPTPPNPPLMLRLMSADPSPSVYVGRPCYYGFSREPECDISLWTSARFSPTVVDSMAGVIRVLQRRHQAKDLWLIGHSGGGALAMLLAARLPAVSHVVTLAGNLDTDAWTHHHGYTPLHDSLNPARQPPLRGSVEQWHLVGAEDRVIPPTLVKNYIRSQADGVGIELAGFAHSCCWSDLWPALLQSVAEGAPERVPGKVFWRGAHVATGRSPGPRSTIEPSTVQPGQ